MSAWRWQNQPHLNNRVPTYYANNKLYPGSYAPTQSQTRTSRRIHDGFSLPTNYGLDTTSDDINSSPYTSPYYINGRYNSDNLTTQRGNAASVQGTKELLALKDEIVDFKEEDIKTTIEMWQGKQIKFTIPYDGKVVGNTITLKNTGESTGILSIYFSTKPDGAPVYETAIDLCKVSPDRFEHFVLHSMTVVKPLANPKKKLYVRMEIWDEISQERSNNPFNTGKKIEIASTGDGNHEACVYRLGEKNKVVDEKYEYKPYPSRPLIGLIYNSYTSVPTERLDNMKIGASCSLNKYRYDIFCIKDENHAEVVIYDREMKKTINNNIKVDGRVDDLYIAQVTDTDKRTWVYYVDGYSPLQRFRVGQWTSSEFPIGPVDNLKATINDAVWYSSPLGNASGTYIFEFKNNSWTYNEQNVSLSTYGISLNGTPGEGSKITVAYTVSEGGNKTIESISYADARPVIGAKILMFHNNRLYLAGFRTDPNLVQFSAIEEDGPNFTQFPYRFYVPNRSPYDTSLDPITALEEYTSDEIIIALKSGYARFTTNVNVEDAMPQQVSSFMDSAGVQSQGDIVNYKGVVYSFDEKEGIRRFSGAVWQKIPGTTVDSHYDRVDMSKPRKMWGYANKLYFNYIDSIDGKAKCLIYDMDMNYQQAPWFQDVDMPFCDARYSEKEEIVGIHPDYPIIMQIYAEDTWARLDTPIEFRRDSKYLSVPGNAADLTVKRCHVKIINNSNRWWWLSLNTDKQNMTQFRGHDKWWRQPVWDTITVEEPAETPFPVEDIYEENAIYRISLMDLRMRGGSVQCRVRTKTFRSQANLVSVLIEVGIKQYL